MTVNGGWRVCFYICIPLAVGNPSPLGLLIQLLLTRCVLLRGVDATVNAFNIKHGYCY